MGRAAARAMRPAKLTPPASTRAVARPRLFALLDDAAERPVVWVAAPAGSGKTTLVASHLGRTDAAALWYQCDEGDADLATFFHYMGLAASQLLPGARRSLPALTPEYLAGVPAFTRRYFEQLYDALLHQGAAQGKPGVAHIVLDNYQEVPAGCPLHETLASALDVIPRGVRAVVVSRDAPPAAFARLLANGRIARIAAEDLRFTREESRRLLADQAASLGVSGADAIHARAEGWAAGIILLFEQARLRGLDAALDHDLAPVFDYLAAQVLERTAPATRRFLLTTSLLPTISVSLAERLTGAPDAAGILATLAARGYFTDRLSGTAESYRFHPLFRDFLLARAAAELAPAELEVLRGRAARIVSESGRTEEAAALLAEIRDWEALARLLAAQASELLTAGRHRTLEGFLRALPEDRLTAEPGLVYWLGACRMPFDLKESRSLLERAFLAFDASGQVEWAFAAWAAVADSIINEHNDIAALDRWLAWLDARGDEVSSLAPQTARETVAYMLFGLTFREPGHPRIGRWRERAEALLQTSPDLVGAMTVGARLLLHYTFCGEIHQAERLLHEIRPPTTGRLAMRPLALIQWEVICASYYALGAGSALACREAVERGLALSRQHGILLFDPLLLYCGAVSAAVAGDDDAADRYLDEMVALRGDFNEMNLAYYLSALAWRDLLHGDFRAAAERMEMVLPVCERLGHTINAVANHVGLAQAYFELGEVKTARAHLDHGRLQVGAESHWFEHAFLASEAYFALRAGDDAAGLAAAAKALALGRRTGVTFYVYWRPQVASLICTRALAAGIEREHVLSLIRRQHLTPDPSSPVPEAWPWPLEIRTLGGFRLLRDGTPVEFPRKTPRKPLELLEALLAFGGRDVPVERLADALWPGADGDLAGKAFESTLSRLRRLLGVEHCLLLAARQVSLDTRRCRADSMALAQLLDRAEAAPASELPQLFDEAARLYGGHFLPADHDRLWAVSHGERLKNRFLALVLATGLHHQQHGAWQRAAACYRKGLEADDLVEELYRRLMLCCARLGERPAALAAYRQCRAVLSDRLGIVPSPETEAVRAALAM